MPNAAVIECPVFVTNKGECVKCSVLVDSPTTVTRFPMLAAVNEKPEIDIHISSEPAKPGLLFDSRGDKISSPKTGFMVKADAKFGERVEFSKGTLWLVGTAFVLIQVAFNYGSSLLGWTRQDQEVRTKVEVMSKQIDSMTDKLDKLSDQMRSVEIKKSYQLGEEAGKNGEKH